MFSLQDAKRSADALDDKTLRSMLERTNSWDGATLDVCHAWSDAARCLAWAPADIDAVTTGMSAVGQKLASGFPRAERRAACDPPAQRPFIRATATALCACPSVDAECEVRGEALADLICRDTQCRAVALYAGRCKDGALDARLLIGSFGFFLVSRVLDGLREEVRAQPPPEGSRLLRSFAPMLVVISEMQREQAERKDALKDAAGKLDAQIAAAQAERDEAEVTLRARRSDARPEDLRVLAQPAPTPPRQKGRRTRR